MLKTKKDEPPENDYLRERDVEIYFSKQTIDVLGVFNEHSKTKPPQE
jgi:hypothetical protein